MRALVKHFGGDMKQTCEVCGAPFDAKRRTAKYCSNTCRVQAQRGAASGQRSRGSSKVVAFGLVPQLPPEPERGPLETAALAELAAVGRAETLTGGVVLALARRIDVAGPDDTGSAFAALAKELRTALAAAMAGAEEEADPIDQLRKQREQKQRERGAG